MPKTLLSFAEPAPEATFAGFVRPAQVIEALPEGGYAVALEHGGQSYRLRGQSALPPGTAIGTGTRVLVSGETLDACYIVGVLGPCGQRGLTTRHGASARVIERDDADRIEVRDSDGALVFEYCPDSGTAVLSVPDGDLRLNAPNGNIDLHSGKGILCRGKTVALAGVGGDAAAPATLKLGRGLAELASPRVKVAAGHAEAAIRDGAYRGARLTVTVEHVKQVFGKLETVAARILERAGDVYRRVDNLHQLKAGRLRTLVKGACHIKGGRTSIKADDDVKIGGRRIHLG